MSCLTHTLMLFMVSMLIHKTENTMEDTTMPAAPGADEQVTNPAPATEENHGGGDAAPAAEPAPTPETPAEGDSGEAAGA